MKWLDKIETTFSMLIVAAAAVTAISIPPMLAGAVIMLMLKMVASE